MPLVLPNEGLVTWLNWLIKDTGGSPPDLVLTLFINDLVPDQATTFSDLERADFNGFMELVMGRSNWTSPIIEDGRATSQWKSVPTEWTVVADPETVYGWAAYLPFPERLMIVERFDVPRPLIVGDTLRVLPRFSLTTAPAV
jgi:hypothetical protein